ncbi:MAG: hypothetical protein AAF851_05710 [Myxococcota bacterium]
MGEESKTGSGGEGATPESQQEGGQGKETSLSEQLSKLNERFGALEQSVEGRFQKVGQDLGAVRDKIKQPKPEPGEQKSNGVGRDDLAAGLKLGQFTSKLSEAAMAKVNARVEAGDYKGAVELAETLVELQGEQTPKPKPPHGDYGGGPDSESSAYPKNLAELLELKKEDPKKYDKLMSPTSKFDPTILQ